VSLAGFAHVGQPPLLAAALLYEGTQVSGASAELKRVDLASSLA